MATCPTTSSHQIQAIQHQRTPVTSLLTGVQQGSRLAPLTTAAQAPQRPRRQPYLMTNEGSCSSRIFSRTSSSMGPQLRPGRGEAGWAPSYCLPNCFLRTTSHTFRLPHKYTPVHIYSEVLILVSVPSVDQEVPQRGLDCCRSCCRCRRQLRSASARRS